MRQHSMTFDELLAQVVELLQRQGRVSYGALKRRFALDDDYLQDLKDELIEAQRVAADVIDWRLWWQAWAEASGICAEWKTCNSPSTMDSAPVLASVRMTLVNAAKVWAPRAFLEHCDTLRAITAGRSALSARLLVGSMRGSSRKRSRLPRSLCHPNSLSSRRLSGSVSGRSRR